MSEYRLGDIFRLTIDEYENFWLFSDLRTLYIDHNGVLIVKDLDFETIYYMKSSG